MPNIAITLASKDGAKEVTAWAPGVRSSLALHRELQAEDAKLAAPYTITHRATGCNINGLLRGAIIDRFSFKTMKAVLEVLQKSGAPLWAELDKLEPGTTRAPKDVIAAHRETYDAMRQALASMSARALRL